MQNRVLDTDGVHLDYDPKLEILDPDGDSLTAALIAYLRHNGVTTYKSVCPCIKFEGTPLEMKTFKLNHNLTTLGMFEEIHHELVKLEPHVAFIYYMKADYIYGRATDPDTFCETEGEPMLHTRCVVRFGVI